eukprot:TRINITY_DN392_c0_g1_i1.p1 TRINITY_DN392_c0_g1~~TRINITY_DN392_c0_g1_i1.p1  ORF type:complete len:310 (+),score=36.61 TRINITY_DN392_c0_g1_i1:108-932(+)
MVHVTVIPLLMHAVDHVPSQDEETELLMTSMARDAIALNSTTFQEIARPPTFLMLAVLSEHLPTVLLISLLPLIRPHLFLLMMALPLPHLAQRDGNGLSSKRFKLSMKSNMNVFQPTSQLATQEALNQSTVVLSPTPPLSLLFVVMVLQRKPRNVTRESLTAIPLTAAGKTADDLLAEMVSWMLESYVMTVPRTLLLVLVEPTANGLDLKDVHQETRHVLHLAPPQSMSSSPTSFQDPSAQETALLPKFSTLSKLLTPLGLWFGNPYCITSCVV